MALTIVHDGVMQNHPPGGGNIKGLVSSAVPPSVGIGLKVNIRVDAAGKVIEATAHDFDSTGFKEGDQVTVPLIPGLLLQIGKKASTVTPPVVTPPSTPVYHPVGTIGGVVKVSAVATIPGYPPNGFYPNHLVFPIAPSKGTEFYVNVWTDGTGTVSRVEPVAGTSFGKWAVGDVGQVSGFGNKLRVNVLDVQP
jgi:hypothetical protein